MKRKGFTLVELLVVIAIIALLMGILMPALARVQELARRVVCGTNTSGIVKAMLVYANDSETGRFPHYGPATTTWAASNNAVPPPVPPATWPENPTATISSALYLLVHFEYCSTKQFVCKSDPGVTELKGGEPTKEWDFAGGFSNCSYAYHTPYAFGTNKVAYGLSGASISGMAVVADRSPQNAEHVEYNSSNHNDEGQSVAYIDAHVKFQKTPFCGANEDNIYTRLEDPKDRRADGIVPDYGTGPLDQVDSVLVSW